jgi:ferredoxin
MRTIRKVEITPAYVEYMPPWEKMKQGVLYISKRGCIACHLCLCGCGEKVAMPLDEVITETEKFATEMPEGGWALTEKHNRVSLTPSIGNFDFPCRSHYIITNNVANFV